MFQKVFCPYCGAHVTEGCTCESDRAEYERELIKELEWRQAHFEWQQDLIDMYRYER